VAKGWQGQTEEARKRFIRRVNAEYRFVGDASEVSEQHFKAKVSIAISRFKHHLNEKIKTGLPKPPEVKQEYWDELLNLQEHPEVKAKSEHMASITQGRPLLAVSKAKRDSTVSALVRAT
jgi:hypothetical protein